MFRLPARVSCTSTKNPRQHVPAPSLLDLPLIPKSGFLGPLLTEILHVCMYECTYVGTYTLGSGSVGVQVVKNFLGGVALWPSRPTPELPIPGSNPARV
jgi:hypothetical protein